MTPESVSAVWTAGARKLCNHLWQSTLFAGIIVLLALLLRKNQARSRYWLWMTATAKIPDSVFAAAVGRISNTVGLAQPLLQGHEIELFRKVEQIAKLARPIPVIAVG